MESFLISNVMISLQIFYIAKRYFRTDFLW